MKHFILLSGLLWLLSGQVLAQPLVLESPTRQAVMIELYTSEGCSSCPPAEAYLNRLTRHQDLWTRYVPLAFHVDYWDDLGWKDAFAKPRYSQRQRHYAHIRRQSTVYTPAFIINGANWRPGFYSKTLPTSDSQPGRLKLVIDQGQIDAQFQPLADLPRNLRLNLALLGMGIESDIRAGENSGKHARHEFVVLSHQQYQSTDGQWRVPVPVFEESMTAGAPVPAFAIAAWVASADDPAPIQSVGGALPSSWVGVK